MNKKFKRALSSVLTFIMVLSCIMVVNVSSVFAASNTYYYIDKSENTSNYFTVSGSTGSTNGISSASYSFEGETESRTPTSATKFDSKGSVVFTVQGTATVEVAFSGKGTNVVSVKLTDGTTTLESGTVSGNSSINVTKFTGVTAGSWTLSRLANKEGCLYAIKVVDTVDDGVSYVWKLDTSDLSEDIAADLSIDTTETSAVNTLTYSGSDYYFNGATSLSISTSYVDYDDTTKTFTVKPTADMFIPYVTTSINVTNGENNTLELVGKTYNQKYSVSLTDGTATANVVADTYSVAMADGELDKETVTIDSTNNSISLVYTAVKIGTIVEVLNASDLTAGDITEEKINGKFKIIADADNKVTVEANGKSVDGFSFTNRLKTNGTSSTEKRAVVFKTTGAGNVVFYALSGSSKEERPVILLNESGTQVGSVNVGSTIERNSIAIPAAGTYYIGSGSSGVNFYYIGTDVALEDWTTAETAAFTYDSIKADGDQYLLIGKTTKTVEELANYSSFALFVAASKENLVAANVNDATKVVKQETGTVYSSITAEDDSTIVGGTDGTYYFGVLVNGLKNGDYVCAGSKATDGEWVLDEAQAVSLAE